MDQIPDSPQTPQRGRSSPSNITGLRRRSDSALLQTLKAPSTSGPKFRTPGMKPPDKFDGENSSRLQGFLWSCELLFLNDPTVFSDDHKKVLYAASYLGVRKAEFELNSLSMKDNGKASTYITQFRTLQSRVDWNDVAFAFHF
ncbi:uncharacterized protein VP01_3005g1 [Puccinia sorghi]|uniref:Retrotransposon gag domain-containing protein n=1 Tax=Puccinia sorghi TaxID=27349 RepID=A0A0L6V0B9_9BASI|nr:uncharacterized protein VP01_3005g1 [Puccinia sorghi]